MRPDQCADFTGIVDHETIIALARTVQTAILVGNPAPIVKQLSEWCSADPQPGDLVVEMSSRRIDGDETRDPEHPGCTDPECLESKAEGMQPERFVHILVQHEPRRTCRWHNASFIRLPKNEQQLREATGRGDAGGAR